jgi:hypothetical protein
MSQSESRDESDARKVLKVHKQTHRASFDTIARVIPSSENP